MARSFPGPGLPATQAPLKDTHPHAKSKVGISRLPFLSFQSVHPGATLGRSTGGGDCWALVITSHAPARWLW